MKNPFDAISSRTAKPPRPGETFGTLERAPGGEPKRREKSGRTEQYNVRVRRELKERVKFHADTERLSDGAILDAMLEAYEAAGAAPEPGAVPIGELRAGRERKLVLWTSKGVEAVIGRVAAAHKMSVSQLIEDLLAVEVARLESRGWTFAVHVKTPNGTENDNS